jgi:hypothetical protein
VTDTGDAESATSCTACTAGRYSPVSTTACDDCIGGITDTGDAESATTCTACVAGQYAEASTEAACTDCPAGSQTDTGNAESATSCTACDAGQYSAVSTTACDDCIGGLTDTGNAESATSCTACAVGQYTIMSTAAQCSDHSVTECPVGEGWVGSTTQDDGRCEACGAGKYSDVVDVTGCKTCGRGTMSGDPTATVDPLTNEPILNTFCAICDIEKRCQDPPICLLGTEGVGCARCSIEPRYYSAGEECYDCAGNWWIMVLIGTALSGTVLQVLWQVTKTESNEDLSIEEEDPTDAIEDAATAAAATGPDKGRGAKDETAGGATDDGNGGMLDVIDRETFTKAVNAKSHVDKTVQQVTTVATATIFTSIMVPHIQLTMISWEMPWGLPESLKAFAAWLLSVIAFDISLFTSPECQMAADTPSSDIFLFKLMATHGGYFFLTSLLLLPLCCYGRDKNAMSPEDAAQALEDADRVADELVLKHAAAEKKVLEAREAAEQAGESVGAKVRKRFGKNKRNKKKKKKKKKKENEQDDEEDMEAPTELGLAEAALEDVELELEDAQEAVVQANIDVTQANKAHDGRMTSHHAHNAMTALYTVAVSMLVRSCGKALDCTKPEGSEQYTMDSLPDVICWDTDVHITLWQLGAAGMLLYLLIIPCVLFSQIYKGKKQNFLARANIESTSDEAEFAQTHGWILLKYRPEAWWFEFPLLAYKITFVVSTVLMTTYGLELIALHVCMTMAMGAAVIYTRPFTGQPSAMVWKEYIGKQRAPDTDAFDNPVADTPAVMEDEDPDLVGTDLPGSEAGVDEDDDDLHLRDNIKGGDEPPSSLVSDVGGVFEAEQAEQDSVALVDADTDGVFETEAAEIIEEMEVPQVEGDWEVLIWSDIRKALQIVGNSHKFTDRDLIAMNDVHQGKPMMEVMVAIDATQSYIRPGWSNADVLQLVVYMSIIGSSFISAGCLKAEGTCDENAWAEFFVVVVQAIFVLVPTIVAGLMLRSDADFMKAWQENAKRRYWAEKAFTFVTVVTGLIGAISVVVELMNCSSEDIQSGMDGGLEGALEEDYVVDDTTNSTDITVCEAFDEHLGVTIVACVAATLMMLVLVWRCFQSMPRTHEDIMADIEELQAQRDAIVEEHGEFIMHEQLHEIDVKVSLLQAEEIMLTQSENQQELIRTVGTIAVGLLLITVL